MNCEQLSLQMSELGAKLILESLDLIESGKVRYISQNEKEATYAKKISKQETKINWNVEAKTLVAKINALYPSPGTWFELNGSRIKVIKAIEIKAKGTPGEVINKNLTIACSKNAIQILELTKEGKKATMASEFLKGNKIKVGTNINNNV